jgi:hypothetical protein
MKERAPRSFTIAATTRSARPGRADCPVENAGKPGPARLYRPRRSSMGFVPENQVRTGLAGGGKGIRTLGPRGGTTVSTRPVRAAEAAYRN